MLSVNEVLEKNTLGFKPNRQESTQIVQGSIYRVLGSFYFDKLSCGLNTEIYFIKKPQKNA